MFFNMALFSFMFIFLYIFLSHNFTVLTVVSVVSLITHSNWCDQHQMASNKLATSWRTQLIIWQPRGTVGSHVLKEEPGSLIDL